MSAVLAVGLASPVWGDAPPNPIGKQPSAPAPTVDDLLQRLSKLEKDVVELRTRHNAVPTDPKEQKLITLLDSPTLQTLYTGSPQNTRYFAARLMLVNLTKDKLSLKRDQVALRVDGQTFTSKEPTPTLRTTAINLGGSTVNLGSTAVLNELEVAPGASATTVVVFPDIPLGAHVPQLILQVNSGGFLSEIDVNAQQRSLLKLTSTRLGPHNGVGMITIAGPVNSINVGALVEELDRCVTDKVGRVLVHFTSTGAFTDPQLRAWLSTGTTPRNPNFGGVEYPFPHLPASIRELHLSNLPSGNDAPTYGTPTRTAARIHKNDTDGLLALLEPIFETLSRDDVVTAIQSGSRIDRAAALAGGAGRLGAEHLPIILKLTDDNDVFIQQAALKALSHFGEKEAVEKLVAVSKKNAEPLSPVAIAALAGSRYGDAHQALLQLLENEPPEGKRNIVKVLAQYPRPIWADSIFAFARDPRSGLNVEALQALVQIGHPKLLDLLKDALNGTDATLKTQAYSLIITRTDRESEQLAIDYTLQELKTQPVNTSMLNLLNRLKDRRALPLLVAGFDRAGTMKSQLLNTLSLLGDQETAVFIISKYGALSTNDKTAALRAVRLLDETKFFPLAQQALLSNDSNLVSTSVQALVEDGGEKAQAALIDAFEKSQVSFAWSYLSNALGNIGTPAARTALVKARDQSPNSEKRTYAVNALLQIRQRSPGYQYIWQAQEFNRQQKWKEAIDQYTLALQVDAQLPEAYAERAHAYSMQEKHAEAAKDYVKALELDPFNAQAVTGEAITAIILDGKYEEAVKKTEAARSKFPNNSLYHYNAACVYGRAVEYLKKDTKLEAKTKDGLIAQYTDTAMSDLKRAIELGYRDLAWFQKDPDLKPFADVPAFKALMTAPAGGVVPGARRVLR